MTTELSQVMKPKTREKLDQDPIDPWSDHITQLYNDISFKPNPASSVSGGVTRHDVSAINPSLRPYERSCGVLKRKFGEFKSL